MLVVDPLKRISIPEIRKLDWFKKDLPAYLSSSSIDRFENEFQNVDTSVIAEIKRVQFIVDCKRKLTARSL